MSFSVFLRVLRGFISSYRAHLVSLASGVALVLAFAPFGWWPVALASIAVLFRLWGEAGSPRAAFRIGFVFGAGQFAAGTWWIFISLNTFGQAPLWLSVPLLGGLIAIMALFPATAGWLVLRLAPRDSLVRRVLLIPAAWVLLEWTRGWFLSGFPWLLLGYSQTDTWLAGYAPLGGVLLASLLVAASGALLLEALLQRGRRSLAPLAVLAILWLGGWGLQQLSWTRPAGAPVSLALVQGNIPQELKWRPEVLFRTMEQYTSLSEPWWGEVDALIWPEAAIPALYRQIPEDYRQALRARTADSGSDLLFGVLQHDAETDRYYNSAVQFDASPRFYHKRHLVPFGEYFPVPASVREWLRLMNLPYADFTPGAPRQPLLRIAGWPVGVSICYEIVFGGEMIADLPEAAWLINISNDAWFGNSIGPHQHFQIARMRAIETGRWLARATNTGITATIAPDGTVVQRYPQFKAGVLPAEVIPYKGATPYVQAGNWPVASLVALLLIGAGIRRWKLGG